MIRVLFANRLEIDQRWAWRLSDPFWRLYFNREAGAEVTTPRLTMAIPAQKVVLVPAWADIHGRCKGTVDHFYIHFATPDLPPQWIRAHCPDPLILPDDPLLIRMLDGLSGDTQSGPSWRLRIQATTAWALARGLEQLDTSAWTDLAAQPADPVVMAAQQVIERRLAEPLSVETLARPSGLSHDHFARRFHRATGRTVMQWIQEQRVSMAADRLIHGADDLDHVAQEVGFANRFHFTRVFTRIIGTPPGTYRRQHQGRPARELPWLH